MRNEARIAIRVLVFAAVATAIGAAGARAQQTLESATPGSELHLTILHTSDEHSALLPMPFVEYRPPGAAHAPPEGDGATAGTAPAGTPATGTRGGFARLATAVERARARAAANGEPLLLTSAGDNITGTPFSWLILEGEAPELSLMREIGYDAVTLGNHEFDYGPERLAAMHRAAARAENGRTRFIATNTRPPPGHALGAAGLHRTLLDTLPNGLRVGFVGLIGEGAQQVAPGAAPVGFEDARAAAATAVDELREAGAHLVVAITHSGLAEDLALARDVPGIDLILGGHDHRVLEEPVLESGTLIVHPGAHLEQVVQLELGYDTITAALRVRNGSTGTPSLLALDESISEHPAIAARIDAYREALDRRIGEITGGIAADTRAVVARSAFPLRAGPPLSETTLGNFVADAMRAAAVAATGERVDFAFQASGQIRGDIVPGASDFNRGDVVFYDVARAVGLGVGPDGRPGYPIVSAWLTGDEVRRLLEVSVLLSGLLGRSYFLQVSGLRAHYDPERAVLLRIPFRGTPIPTGRAVLSAERETPRGYVPLERGDTALYHVVTDRYVISFLPLVGRLVPRLAITPKTREGLAVENLDDAIVRREGEELKVWQATVEYAAAQPPGEDGVARIPDLYAGPADRLVRRRGAPVWLWPAGGLALLAMAVVVLAVAGRARRRRTRRR